MADDNTGLVEFRVHESEPELGYLCLICSYNKPGWVLMCSLRGDALECSECGHYFHQNEQKRFNEWLVWFRTGAPITELSLQGIRNFARVSAGFLEAERYEYLLKEIDRLMNEMELIELANGRLLRFVDEGQALVKKLSEKITQRLADFEEWEGE
jgi:uncharacterized Fe-S cluster-containing radical SAM superfamily protein